MRLRGHTINSVSSIFFNSLSHHHQRHKPFLYHSIQTLAPFVSSQSENFATDASAVDDDAKYGFRRPDMFKSNLAGTVDPPYDRHVFLCYKSHEVWPSRIEVSDDDPLPKLFAGALKPRKSEMKVKTRLTICERSEEMGLSDGDVLIFPEMIKCRGLREADVDGFVEDVLVSGKSLASGMQEKLTGTFVFVCAHNNRDQRCGVCGPALIEKFKSEIEAKDLKDQVFLTACSHIGGHKYAGNLIIFSADSGGKIAGHWYGYVTPADVDELLDQHIGKGEIIQRIWRGQMGVQAEETDKLEEPILPNGTTLNSNEEKPQELGSEESKCSMVSCCKGANGVKCCRYGSFENPKENGLRRLCNWMEKREQHEVLTSVAVVGAVVSVAVAYGFFRNSI